MKSVLRIFLSSGLVLLFIVVKCLDQAAQYLGRGFAYGL
jgi:hypothetical protein